MSILVLLPGIISFVLVLRGRIETAFLSVYLPSLLLLPADYSLRIKHIPSFSAAEFALMPIGLVALWQHLRSGSFRVMDALVFLFWVSWSASEILGEPVMSDGIQVAVAAIVFYLMAYATGRRLIEPDLRVETVRRIVIFILLLGPIGLYEWRFGRSPYGIFGEKVLGITSFEYGTGLQQRSGRGRMAVSLSNGELAGTVFALTFALNAWLVFLNRARTKLDLEERWLNRITPSSIRRVLGSPQWQPTGIVPGEIGGMFAKLEKYRGLLFLCYIWLTQSRGPLIALAAGFPILLIPRFKHTKLALGLVAALLIVGAVGADQYFRSYTETKRSLTEQQSSVTYRREMNIAYQSIAEMGGWLGWSKAAIPTVGAMRSIDNEFLLVHLMQGEFGYIVWILIVAESVRTVVARILTLQASEDRAFACSALAALAILWTSYYTVYMGAQLPQITFLLLGWSQSITAARTSTAPVTAPAAQPKFAFRHL
jgi:hypothetical protein